MNSAISNQIPEHIVHYHSKTEKALLYACDTPGGRAGAKAEESVQDEQWLAHNHTEYGQVTCMYSNEKPRVS